MLYGFGLLAALGAGWYLKGKFGAKVNAALTAEEKKIALTLTSAEAKLIADARALAAKL